MANGGMKASENAFDLDFPTAPLQAWVAPSQHNVVMHKGKPHNIIVVPDKDATVVNKMGDSSMRGGLLAKKVYNPSTGTRDRLTQPLVRIGGSLQPVTWEFALDIAAAVGQLLLIPMVLMPMG
jgi:arsenite oxidase large subunit